MNLSLSLSLSLTSPSALYVSYDTDAVPDKEKRWAMIWEYIGDYG